MRALSNLELDSVSGGCFLGNLLGGLFGGGSCGNSQNPLAPAANTNTTPAATNGVQASYPVGGSCGGGLGGLGGLLGGPVQVLTGILQGPLTLIGSCIQQAVNCVTRLI
ncbi:hypothetical protein J3T99_05215 [Acetobacteraceae bacterium B3987]|nr:hypothetical protein [Acetobacteraceae bacterium B3987]